jgi:hypothetical protein
MSNIIKKSMPMLAFNNNDDDNKLAINKRRRDESRNNLSNMKVSYFDALRESRSGSR